VSYGPQKIKKRVWNKEYAENKWHFADNTIGDCVYSHLEEYAAAGSILDLGCGSGNTATELDASVYQSYFGVDISEKALDKARLRTKESGREGKNRFACADFLAFIPTQQFDVILFRESMYHVPMGKIKVILDRYSKYLKEDGVFIVRMFVANRDDPEGKDKHRPTAMLAIMEAGFDVIEKCRYPVAGQPTVIVFRPKKSVAAESSIEGQRVREARSTMSS
jgi:2-polyprenyl-3-methyl-5-hydroxy-6-metoxy-1,4-benzoquinol methylase